MNSQLTALKPIIILCSRKGHGVWSNIIGPIISERLSDGRIFCSAVNIIDDAFKFSGRLTVLRRILSRSRRIHASQSKMERNLHQVLSSRKRKYEEGNEEAQDKKTEKQRRLQEESGHDKHETNTSETDCFTDAVNVNKLSKLIQSTEPEGILSKLLTPRFGFIERMNLGSTTQVLTEMLIEAISVACQSKDSDSLIRLLCHLNGSKFLKVDLLRYLNLFITDEEMSAKVEVLQEILNILRILVGKFPRKSLDTVTLLLAPIHYLQRSRGIDVSVEDLDEELRSVRRNIQLKVPTHDVERVETCVIDTENFRWLSIAPTCDDVKGKGDPYLRKNKIFTPYTNVNDYLDVQFRLLREDLIRPLREGLAELLDIRKEGTAKKRKSIMKIYQKVQIISWRCSTNGIIYKLHFDTSRLKRVKWGAGKRLKYGSLVCLSADQFQTMLIGTIANSNAKDLCNGVVFVSFESENIETNLVRLNCHYEMIESPAYYEPYKNVLGVLQYMDEKALPFQKYLLNHGQKEVPPPKYLLNRNFNFDFSSAINRADNKCIEQSEENPTRNDQSLVLNLNSWPSAEQLGLDESQYGALKAALTKEFSVIQGPPGTGKTFIGVLIVQLLLANKYWLSFSDLFSDMQPNRGPLWTGPILIVCYTNHALDQFLEDIIRLDPDRAHENKIVRLGSRCSSENEILKRCQLSEIKRRPCYWTEEISQTKHRLRDIEYYLTESAAFVELAREELLHEDVLKEFMSHGQYEMLTRYRRWEPSILLLWLFDIGGNAWQSNLLHQEDDSYNQADAHCYEDQWNDQVWMQNDVDEEKSVNAFIDCKEKMRQVIYFKPFGEIIYLRPWQSLRKIHQRFQEVVPFYEEDVWNLTLPDRWRLYNFWVSLCVDNKMAERETALQDYTQEKTTLDNRLKKQYRDILAEADIVAMTTTAAAKNNEVLKTIKIKIVIVEEAAEVLEAHIVASLSEHCQHLILIGDHQQLRPKPADDRLARHYWLHISLFERMVLNKMNCECLTIQHRMRPEISKLLVPHIYRSLQDHSNVHEYDDIAGVMGNLFFLSHSFEESGVDDMRSHSNEHEASFLSAFCKYLLNVGYAPDKITVLTMYTGQLFLLRKHFPKTDFEGVRITQVDNFQGEENEIILLSLVRSNKKNNIGFLSIPNRVCVALSRARKGLYIIGNGDLLRDASPLWRDILDTLKSEGRLVEKIPLGCRKHTENVSYVSCTGDFGEVPTYGCKYPCEYRLDCGHVCERNCHPFDQKHEKYKCRKPCERIPVRCMCGHTCQKRCFENCGDCEVIVKRTLSGCQHEASMPCCMNEIIFRCKERCNRLCKAGHQCKNRCCDYCGDCEESVKRILTLCQHEATMLCYMSEEMYLQRNRCRVQVERVLTRCGHLARMDCSHAENNYSCIEACKKLCPAGHACPKKCYEICGKCEVKVDKILPRCQHTASLPCHQSEETFACKNKCSKACSKGHPCRKLCFEPCGDCTVLVSKTLPLCKHEAMVACYAVSTDYTCKKPCTRLCPFGHKCLKICGVNCGKCQVRVKKILPKCGHSNTVECHQSPDDVVCLLPCKKSLPCGHICQEICGLSECTISCKIKVEKLLHCGHKVRMECFVDPEEYQCREKIEVTTCTYGHKKKIECCDGITDLSQCQTLITKKCSTKLHIFSVLCSLQNDPVYKNGCQKKCNVKLKCGHRCGNTCQQCVTDKRHTDCTERCQKYLPLCSHKCRLACGHTSGTCCSTCICVIKCHHRSLEQGCNEPYKPCGKPCRWTCPHHSCKAICSHPCDRVPCNEPCHNKLKTCGHSCIGLCGEVCPKICRLCDKIQLKEMTEELSEEITDESRFLILKPCDHVVEKSYMDSWVKRHTKVLPPYKLRGSMFLKCPVCTSKVDYCHRYNQEMKTYELHINMAKERMMDSKTLARKTYRYSLHVFKLFHIDLPKDIMEHRLILGTLCLLCETRALVDSRERNKPFVLISEEIAQAMCSNDSIDYDHTSLAIGIIRAYRLYLEVQVNRLKRVTRGPKLKIIDSCEDIFKSLLSITATEVDFQKTWNAIEKVNSRLSTKLDKRERKDGIEDYIQHMNQFYDLELNANFNSQWYCCSKGHVYSREEEIKEDQIDSNCSSCNPMHKRLLNVLQENRPEASIVITENAGANKVCHDELKEITGTKLATDATTTGSSDTRSSESTIDQDPLKKDADMSNNKRCTASSASSPKTGLRLPAEATATKTTVATATSTTITATSVNVTSRVPRTEKDDHHRRQTANTTRRLKHAEGSESSKKTYSEKTKDLDPGEQSPPESDDRPRSRQQLSDRASSSRKRRRQDSPTERSSSGRWNEPRTVISLGYDGEYTYKEEPIEHKLQKLHENDHRRSYGDGSRHQTSGRTLGEERYSYSRKRDTEGRRRYQPTGYRHELVNCNTHRMRTSMSRSVADRRFSFAFEGFTPGRASPDPSLVDCNEWTPESPNFYHSFDDHF